MKTNVPYSTLAFTLYRKCSAACAMCCFSSNPKCTEKLNTNRIKEYIDESKEIDDIKTISFTGGEPFMEYETLVDLVSYASQTGKRVTTITNGYWAFSYDIAYTKLKRLRDVGLKHISVSHDSYHKKYVKTEYVGNLLRAASNLGISTTMATVKIKGEKVGYIFDELDDAIYGTELEVIPCLPAGGAKNVFANDQLDHTIATDIEGLRCVYAGNIVVAYNGLIYPCCSQMVFETGLSIGHFENMSLHEALHKIKNNGLLYLLRNKELSIFIDYARNELKMDLPKQIVNPCELCALLFSEKNTPRFKDFVDKEIDKILKS